MKTAISKICLLDLRPSTVSVAMKQAKIVVEGIHIHAIPAVLLYFYLSGVTARKFLAKKDD
jgi:hypothetical protein